jgi:hypothetical protein
MDNATQKIIAQTLIAVQHLTSEVQELRAIIQGTAAIAEGWTDSATAWQALKPQGVKSQGHLQRLRRDQVFSELKGEIRNVSKGDRPTWEYHIPSCRKALQRHFRKVKAAS